MRKPVAKIKRLLLSERALVNEALRLTEDQRARFGLAEVQSKLVAAEQMVAELRTGHGGDSVPAGPSGLPSGASACAVSRIPRMPLSDDGLPSELAHWLGQPVTTDEDRRRMNEVFSVLGQSEAPSLMVARAVSRKEVAANPVAEAACQLEHDRLEKQGTWDPKEVREFQAVKRGAEQKG